MVSGSVPRLQQHWHAPSAPGWTKCLRLRTVYRCVNPPSWRSAEFVRQAACPPKPYVLPLPAPRSPLPAPRSCFPRALDRVQTDAPLCAWVAPSPLSSAYWYRSRCTVVFTLSVLFVHSLLKREIRSSLPLGS